MTAMTSALGALWRAAALTLAASSACASPVEVLGIRLGGPVPTHLMRCTDSSLRQGPCWAATHPQPGRRSVSPISFLGVSAAPDWVRWHTADLLVSEQGVVEMLRITLIDERYRQEMTEAISARFGHPQSMHTVSATSFRAQWDRPGVHVLLSCTQRLCMAQFAPSAEKVRHDLRPEDALLRTGPGRL